MRGGENISDTVLSNHAKKRLRQRLKNKGIKNRRITQLIQEIIEAAKSITSKLPYPFKFRRLKWRYGFFDLVLVDSGSKRIIVTVIF